MFCLTGPIIKTKFNYRGSYPIYYTDSRRIYNNDTGAITLYYHFAFLLIGDIKTYVSTGISYNSVREQQIIRQAAAQ